ncbi:MAG: hypothetical protein NC132_01505 [Corallococcus sp.]|nr:hypothetical protein [Corallococcus sp.]MCM1359334.1 hypothetical protein [Corallococcus sp.]MCM1394777.1 hypothetical protein [Corallococcus sp.]
MEKQLEQIKALLEKHNKDDYVAVRSTIDMLCAKGVPNGFYQNMQILIDVLAILELCASAIKEQ